VSFTRRYLLWLLAPPAVVALPLSFLFLAQVVQLTASSVAIMLAMLVVLYGGGALTMRMLITPQLAEVESALAGRGDLSRAMSEALDRTTRMAVLLWAGGAIVFAVLGTLLVMRSGLGFSYFLVAALISAFPSIAWGYAASKHLLMDVTPRGTPIRYTGREIALGRKIAVVFIGSLVVAAAVLVTLISSKVSTTLEGLAIASSAERFQRIFDNANLMAKVDAQELDTLKLYVPDEFALHVIAPNGTLASTKDPLTPFEVAEIRRIKTGDSLAFISPHVCRFAELRNGSILVLSIPWAPYSAIPRQITVYTVIIALLTMLAFVLAAYVLARDVGEPIRELRELARQMAEGNFEMASQVFADDEIGQLADSFGETRANLRRLLARVGGSGTTITDGVRVITGGTESLLSRSRDQADLTESSSLAVENVRGGISSVLQAADTVTELTQDASSRALELQASAEEVARSMDYLFQSVEKTSSSTTEMNASMSEMSNRTDVLAGIGDEVLSFVSQMDSTVGELRSSAMSTAEISRRVREDAEAGGEAVDRTVEGIKQTKELTDSTAKVLDELQQSVGSITQVLNVIEEVTNRTNLLALNAAIIAAQAGEHGAGFTVVADEIRQLAERTRGSTKEINEIIKAVQGGSRQAVSRMREGVVRVEDNVRLADAAAVSLAKIVESATKSFEMATTIAVALDDQAKASRHLHEVTSRMSDHIAEINRATREQARGTQLLAQESDRVREIAAQVKNATDEQSMAGRGITTALEKIAEDARAMRDLLERQLHETDRIADASRMMLDIAQENDAIAREFNKTVQNLVQSGQDFESEVARFRIRA
jgi:methyl-accepting chemotaxis protein